MSEVKVNKISPRTNCGTVQLGDSGDTFTIPAGATITNNGTAAGFGATGAASWDTTVKTGDFTAVSGVGYFVNTTSGEIDVTLPASPSAGAVVALKDYANTWDTNNCILLRNGSNIGGQALNSTLITEGLAVTLVYVDATKGWLVTDSGLQDEAPGPQYITATGGTILTSGDFKTHVFTGPGTFTVCSTGNAAGSTSVDYLVVAGGGSGGSGNGPNGGGGGGAGGFRLSNSYSLPAPTTSPLANPTGITVTAQGYPITIGGGGAPGGPSCSMGNNGTPSTALGLTSTAGGFGSGNQDNGANPGNGGPGGSGGGRHQSANTIGAGNTPPVSPPQGQPGGDGSSPSGEGGGGAGLGGCFSASGWDGTPTSGGRGGTGSFIDDSFLGPTAPSYGTPGPVGSTRYLAGGGGGSNSPTRSPTGTAGTAGAGGGGAGGGPTGTSGTINTGGGSGAGGNGPAGTGGSGIVMIRYKFQN